MRNKDDNSRDVLTRATRIACWIAGATVAAWAIRSPWFRGPDGSLMGTVCLPVAAVVALVLVGIGRGRSYRPAMGWLAVAAIGQAVSLQMIDAGPRLHYQHYESIATLWRTRPWLLVCVGGQTTVAAVALFTYRRRIAGVMRGSIRPWQVAIAALLSCAAAATVSEAVSRYLAELVFAAYLQLLAVATIVIAVLSITAADVAGLQRRLDRVLGQPGDAAARFRPDRVAWLAALLVTACAAVLSLYSYQRHPHIEDEVAYVLQARYMTRGLLSMPAPPVPEAFTVEQMYFEPHRWFAPLPPGWPAVLALGVRLGAPWLVNPILGGINVLLAFLVLLHVYDRRVARLGVALMALSPWYVFLSMSLMSHMLALTGGLAAMVGVIQARRTERSLWGLMAGAAIGGLVLVRPLDAAIVAAALGLWSLGLGGARLKPASIAALVLGTVVVGSLTLPYNAHLTGDPWVFPVNAFFEKYWGHNSNAYGFGPDRGAGWAIDPNPGHGPIDALINANLNTFSLNTDLFGWSTGSLIFITLLVCSGSIGRGDRVMIGLMLLVFGAYFFYYFSGGPDFGARYWFLMMVPLVALTVRGIDWLARAGGARVFAAVCALSALALVNYVPWRAVDKYHHYLGMRPDVRDLAASPTFDGALVLIQGRRFPDYESAVVYNPVDLTSRAPIFAWDRDPGVRADTLRAFRDRPVWIVAGPTVTHSGYRVVEGPLSAADLMARTAPTP